MSEKCCPRADVVSTHFEGCHTVHPECAAYKAGYEAGLRRAANVVGEYTVSIDGIPNTGRNLSPLADAILAEIKGE